jgi:hypothetical protein
MNKEHNFPRNLTGPALSRVWNIAAYELREGERYCTCCERDLTGGAGRMLELDQRTDTYHDFGDVPEEKSQGWFPFGLTCARKKIKEAKAKRGEA